MFLNDFLKYALCYFPSSRSFPLYCLPSSFPINALPTPHFSHFQPCNLCHSSLLSRTAPSPDLQDPFFTLLASVVTINVTNSSGHSPRGQVTTVPEPA